MALTTVLDIPGVAPAEAGCATGSTHYRHIHPIFVAAPAEAESDWPSAATVELPATPAQCTCAKHTGRFDYAGSSSRRGTPAECSSN